MSGSDGHPGAADRATADGELESADESLVDVRCSVAVIRQGMILLLHRHQHDDWVLPGGRPREGESLAACARREVREETALDVHPERCAFVLEVIEPVDHRRVVEIVFAGAVRGQQTPVQGEPGSTPEWVGVDELRHVNLRPPLAGYLPSLLHSQTSTAPYLGNLWRPGEVIDRVWARPHR